MSFLDRVRALMGESRPQPPSILTEAEATERARIYADANGHRFEEPVSISLHRRLRDREAPQDGHRYIYVLALGTSRPVPFVEVDAADGTVLAWRSLSR